MPIIEAPRTSPLQIQRVAAIGLLLACFAILYHNVIVKLVNDWIVDDNYSHGFFIVPLALYFAWERRDRLDENAYDL